MHIKSFLHPWGDLLSLDYSSGPTARLVMIVHVVGHLAGNSYKSHSFAPNKLTRSLFQWTVN